MTGFLRKSIFNVSYIRRPPWDSGISPPELMEFINSHAPGRALDLGCGTGTNSITLAKCGWQITGVDFAPLAISKAKKKAGTSGVAVDFRVADVTRLEGIKGPFDFLLDLGCFHSLAGQEKRLYLDKVTELSAQPGYWLLYGFFKTDASTPGPGLVSGDLEEILKSFDLLKRKDGVDRRERPSAYFLFSKKIL
jgi:cyclopropane fatty-acyl-phospholipid synthase-like methyltransferase